MVAQHVAQRLAVRVLDRRQCILHGGRVRPRALQVRGDELVEHILDAVQECDLAFVGAQPVLVLPDQIQADAQRGGRLVARLADLARRKLTGKTREAKEKKGQGVL